MKFARFTAAAVLAAALTTQAGAQVTTHRRHETTANRQNRLDRQIRDTYSRRWEVGGGGGFLRFEPGPSLRRDNQIDWATVGTYYVTPAYGLTADIRGHYGDVKINNTTGCVGVSPNIVCGPNVGDVHPLVTEYTFLVGPQWRFYRKEKYAISGSVLAGMALGNFDGGSKGFPGPVLGMWPDKNGALTMSANVNLDYNFYPNFAFRWQPTYVYTRFGGANQNNKGMNFELIYRFGRIK